MVINFFTAPSHLEYGSDGGVVSGGCKAIQTGAAQHHQEMEPNVQATSCGACYQ